MGWLFATKTLCLFEVDLKAAPALPCEARIAVEYRCIDATSWAVQHNTTRLLERHLYPARFARGEHFWIAHQADDILAYCWATQEPVEIGEIRCVMSPRSDEVYLYDAFTFAEHRGQNLYPALLQRMLDASRKAGLRRALIFVMSDNTASIRGVQKAGFREFQRVTCRNIFGFARYAYQPLLNAPAGVALLPA
jgi:L-amino acid N-acyltransferase YncA